MQRTSQQGETFEFDVIVIGSGVAGMHYCLQLLKINPQCRIALFSKAEQDECNSRYAQGGIAAVMSPLDSFDSHSDDTFKAGDGLCYPPAIDMIIQEGPRAIHDLRHDYAVAFTQTQAGEFALGQEGGHQHRRILHCGDQTGLSLVEQMLLHVRRHSQIHCFEHHIAVNLITQYQRHHTDNQGEVLGAYILDCKKKRIHAFLSRCVVLASGGAGKTYRYTTNPMVATGDGVAMAYRVGARIGNMEFYQFHPTLLHHASITDFLISEAVRGEGARLRNASTNELFMHHYAPEQLELATRDIVSRAIFNEIEQSHIDYVYLDITHRSKAFLKKRFPQIYTTLHAIGIDMSQDMIPVVPAAHYQCGGILTDLHGKTDLQRLYAIGEVAFTGLHGANRLASNSLLEAVVMASRAARACMLDIKTPPKHLSPEAWVWNHSSQIMTQRNKQGNSRRASQINAHWRSIRGEMTSYAGIIRTEAGLEDILHLIKKRQQIIEDYYWQYPITRDFIELRNIILNAELIVNAALARRESRGGHYRDDFPHKSPHAKESIARFSAAQTPYI